MEQQQHLFGELIAWAKTRKGNLRAVKRKNGTAHLFRYRLGGQIRSKNFPVGTDMDFIKSFIADIEAKILKEKLGLEDFTQPPVPEKPKRLTVYELLEWYIRSTLKESIGERKEEARAYSIVTIERNEYVFKRFIQFLKSDDVPADEIEKRHLYEYAAIWPSSDGWIGASRPTSTRSKRFSKKRLTRGFCRNIVSGDSSSGACRSRGHAIF